MPGAPPRLSQLDAAHQQHQFFMCECDLRFAALCFRPAEATLLETLGAHPQTTAVPEQQLQAVALRIRKQEDMPAQRIARRGSTIETTRQSLCRGSGLSGRAPDICGPPSAPNWLI